MVILASVALVFSLCILCMALQQGSDGRKIMKAMEAALSANGSANIALDLGLWTLTADLPTEDDGSTVSGAQKRQRHPSVTVSGVAKDGPAASIRINLFQQQRGR